MAKAGEVEDKLRTSISLCHKVKKCSKTDETIERYRSQCEGCGERLITKGHRYIFWGDKTFILTVLVVIQLYICIKLTE